MRWPKYGLRRGSTLRVPDELCKTQTAFEWPCTPLDYAGALTTSSRRLRCLWTTTAERSQQLERSLRHFQEWVITWLTPCGSSH